MRIFIEDNNQDFVSQVNGISFIQVDNDFCDIKISNRGLQLYPDWQLTRVPFVYPDRIDQKYFDELSSIHQGNFSSNSSFHKEYPLVDCLSQCLQTIFQEGVLYTNIFEDVIPQTQFEEYAIAHNRAVLLHFNQSKLEIDPEEINECFKHAAYLAPDAYWMSFTHYLNMIFLLENQRLDEAYDLAIRIERRISFNEVRSIVLLTLFKYMCVQEDTKLYADRISQVSEMLFSITNLPNAHIDTHLALSLHLETTHEFEKAIDEINRSIDIAKIYNTNQVPYLYASLGDLQLKAAQFGDTMQYQSAQHAYQQALKEINRENDPQRYALCQMNLGIIYAEMPIRDIKRHVYAGLAQTAFTESMQIFNKFDDPYQYAVVCTNFANAMLRLLPDIDKDRFDKISFYLFEALNIRRANQFPEERAITIGTLLNLYFHRIETAEEIDPQWLEEMRLMSEEITTLTTNDYLLNSATEAIKFVQETKTEQMNTNA